MQDSREGAQSSAFALPVSQHNICVFQSMAKLQPSNSVEFKVSQSICGQVCTKFTEFGRSRGGKQCSCSLDFSVLPCSLLRMGMDLAVNPAKSAPLGLVRTKRAVTSATRLHFFPTVVSQEERPVPGLPSRTYLLFCFKQVVSICRLLCESPFLSGKKFQYSATDVRMQCFCTKF